MPKELFELTHPFCIGLTAAPDRLVQVRRNRLLLLKHDEETDYVDIDTVKREIADARKMFARQRWAVIDVTRRSIEETATTIFQLYSKHMSENSSERDGAIEPS